MTLTKNPTYDMEKIKKRINFEGSMGKKINECSGHIASGSSFSESESTEERHQPGVAIFKTVLRKLSSEC